MILTSSFDFDGWDSAFARDGVLTVAMLDRILHRSTIVNRARRDHFSCLVRSPAVFEYSPDSPYEMIAGRHIPRAR